jgi:hypothetical protein
MSTLRTYAPIGLGLGLALLLAGCGGGTTTPQAAGATGNAAAPSSAPQPARTPGAGGGGVSGTIAYVAGQLMQVQDTSMQSAVTWTGTTTISKETAGTLADVTAGRCVVATSFTATQGGTGTSTAAPTAQPTVDPNAPATRVTITDPVNGTCQGGAGGFGGGGFPGGVPSGLPTGQAGSVPTARPSGAAGGFGAARAGIHTGLVTGVSGDSVSIQATAQDGTKSTSTFTVGSSTTYTTTVKADAGAIVVGQCASAFGPSDTSGQVAATSITVSAPVSGKCTSFSANRAGGFGGRNRGGTGTGSTSTQGGSNA